MGLYPASHPHHSNRPRTEKGEHFNDGQLILSAVLERVVDVDAMALSQVLLKQFGSLSSLIKQCEFGQSCPKGLPIPAFNMLHAISKIIYHVLRTDAFSGDIVSNHDTLVAFLFHDMAHLQRETFRVLFLDAQNTLLVDEVMWEGTVNKVQIHPREVVRRALDTNATALIFAHNHPSGNPTPSAVDIKITQELSNACALFDLVVHDHLVISRHGCVSMRTEGIMS